MSSEPAVRVRGLGKAYRIAEARSGVRDTIRERLRDPLLRGGTEFWALRDVSFDVSRGEVLGVIGRNGAGKSTLLKILSRITVPTTGEAVLQGHAGSLLEVGTGFHRELTGRENIYLNGSILGLGKAEIDRQFDAIVDFSGVARFLDTPIKRYSSGMFVRLAFAVAAHLRAEILIVDEVLAVGDLAFQARCLDKMRDVTREGRTVLFVSHNMGTMRSLCARALLLQEGRLVHDGHVDEVVQAYIDALHTTGGAETALAERPGTGEVEMVAVRLVDSRGSPTGTVVGGTEVGLEIEYANHAAVSHVRVIANLYDAHGRQITSFSTPLTAPDLGTLAERGILACRFPRMPLPPGRYHIALALHADGRVADTLKSAVRFDVVATTFFPTGASPEEGSAAFLIDHEWSHDVPAELPSGTRVAD